MTDAADLYAAHPGFFDLAHVRANAPALAQMSDEALIVQLLDPENSTPPAPNGLFDPQHYTLLRLRAGEAEPRNPILHYLTEGADLGLPINALFDAGFYRRNAGVEGLSPIALVTHALAHIDSGLAPFSPFVDVAFISAQMGRAADGQMLRDLFSGALQTARPHPLVDLNHLQGQTVCQLGSVQEALFHYWTCGEDLSTHPLIDVAYYKSRCTDGARIAHGAYHYLISPAPASPHPLFDPEFYLAQIRAAGGQVPRRALEHFVTRGQAEGLDPSPFFDVAFYRQSAGCGPEALQHYLSEGLRRHAPHPMIRLSEAQLHAQATDTAPQEVIAQLATAEGEVPLALVPEVHLPFIRQRWDGQDLTPGALLRLYFRKGYPEGHRPNGLLGLPYIEGQCRRAGIRASTPLAAYFEQGWHRRKRLLIALSSFEDTAANRAWLALCQGLLEAPGVECVVVGPEPGPLAEGFCQVAHVWYLAQQPLAQTDPPALDEAAAEFAAVLAANPPQVAFVDCAGGPMLLTCLTRLSVPLVAFGDAGLWRFSEGDLVNLAGQAALVLCTAPDLQAALQQALPEAADRIRAGFHAHVAPSPPSPKQRASARAALGIAPDEVVVLSSGGPGIEHGTDLFGALVAQCCEDERIAPAVSFLWHGAGTSFGNQPKFYTRHFARTAGGDARLRMTQDPDLPTTMAAADIYVKLGRDGCPLDDALLARAAGLPVVLMRGASGAEPADDAALRCIPPFDLTAARQALLELLAISPDHRGVGAHQTAAGLNGFLDGVNAALRRVAPALALPLPAQTEAGQVLLILPDEALVAGFATEGGQAPDAPITLLPRHLVNGALPGRISALLSRHAGAEVALRADTSALTPEDIQAFDHAIWLTRGTEAELREIYLKGLAFDEIHSAAQEQIDAMGKMNPRIAEVMQLTRWRAS